MTEESDDGKNLVQVCAQVMMRDDSTGGWVPMGGGGLSNVSVRKRNVDHQHRHEYLIYGKRISDQTVVLSCTIKKDFEYNKVMPTFHHWRTGDHKYGLTFQTAADARTFDRGVRSAVDDLLDGLTDLPPIPYGYCTDVEDEVFMTIDLPVEREGSRSSSVSVTTSSGSRHTPVPTPEHPHCGGGGGDGGVASISPSNTGQHTHHKMSYTCRHAKTLRNTEKDLESKSASLLGSPVETGGDTYSYVEFDDRPATAVPQYPKRSSISSIKKELAGDTGQVTCKRKPKNKRNGKAKCRHCHESFTEDTNSRGSCEYAPDCVQSVINKFTCIKCAQCMLYHCMSDAEGDFAHHPCECAGVGAESCGKRWLGLALLSLIVPCLWCYPPLWACHRCAVACGICGGKHQAS